MTTSCKSAIVVKKLMNISLVIVYNDIIFIACKIGLQICHVDNKDILNR